VTGRFLSRDPLLIPRTAATTNPYAFAMNDPVNGADPSGLDCTECQRAPGVDWRGGIGNWSEFPWPIDIDINQNDTYPRYYRPGGQSSAAPSLAVNGFLATGLIEATVPEAEILGGAAVGAGEAVAGETMAATVGGVVLIAAAPGALALGLLHLTGGDVRAPGGAFCDVVEECQVEAATRAQERYEAAQANQFAAEIDQAGTDLRALSDSYRSRGNGRIVNGYHGTNGDNVLNILNSGVMRPSNGEIYLSENLADTFVHGADTKRGAAFSTNVTLFVPEGADIVRVSRPGNPQTIIIRTNTPIVTRVNALYARVRLEGAFVVSLFSGERAIRNILE